MRIKLFTIFFLTCLALQLNAQDGLVLKKLNSTCDSAVIRVKANFAFGEGSTCPKLIDYNFTLSTDTLFLELYYDVSGIWSALGCSSIDTLTSETFPNNLTLKAFGYSVNGTETNLRSTRSIEICSTSSLQTVSNPSFFRVFPNPSNEQINFEIKDWHHFKGNIIKLYNLIGEVVLTKSIENLITTIPLSQFPKGVYYLSIQGFDTVEKVINY